MPCETQMERRGAGDVLSDVRRRLEDAGVGHAALEARVLVGAALGMDAADLIARPEHRVPCDREARLEGMIERRLGHEPVSRILGRREFWSLDFEVGPATLDPRPDSETLIEAALEIAEHEDWGAASGNARRRIIADLGTGSGCLLIALSSELPQTLGYGFDLSPEALRMAWRNARAHSVEGRISLVAADWLAATRASFDLIVSNPPYIRTGDLAELEPEVTEHDPTLALDGGEDGLDAYRRIIGEAPGRLAPGGWLVLEIGEGQAAAVRGLMRDAGLQLEGGLTCEVRDLGGRVRCLRARL